MSLIQSVRFRSERLRNKKRRSIEFDCRSGFMALTQGAGKFRRKYAVLGDVGVPFCVWFFFCVRLMLAGNGPTRRLPCVVRVVPLLPPAQRSQGTRGGGLFGGQPAR